MTDLKFTAPNSSLGQERRERPEPEAALAIGSFAAFAAALGAVMFMAIPDQNEKYVMLMLGALIGLVKDTFARYFSSTKGSQEQRRETAEVAKTLAVAAAAGPPPVASVPFPDAGPSAPGGGVPVATGPNTEATPPSPGSKEVMP